MKKYVGILCAVLSIIMLLSSCSLPFFPKELEPFEEGMIAGGTYFNFQANFKYSVPVGWEIKTRSETKNILANTNSNSSFNQANEKVIVDLLAGSNTTGSSVVILFAPASNVSGKNFDAEIDKAIEDAKTQFSGAGQDFQKMEQFPQTISGREFRVDLMETTLEDITLQQYICSCLIDSYICLVFITPSPIGGPDETFEALVGRFSIIKEPTGS